MVASVAAGTSTGYYLKQTEYYLGGREPAGSWLIAGPGLGIKAGGRVKARAFERLHAARHARGPLLLSNSGGKAHVGGYDVTFSPPKSVSALWGLGDNELQREIEQAQEHAVAAAIAMLNRHAAFCRRGKGGRISEAVNLTVALFRHGESRPAKHKDGRVFADFSLHHHACVLSVAQRADGTFGALDGRAFFAWKMVAGAVYHCELARRLQQLGLAIKSTGDNGLFEVDGVDRDLCTYFSARRNEIQDELAAIGIEHTSDAPALAAAKARATRRSKGEKHEDRHQHWRSVARSRGFEASQVIERALDLGAASQSAHHGPEAAEALIQERVSAVPRLLTETKSVFEHRHLAAAVAAALVGTGAGAERARAELERLVADGEVIALGRNRLWPHPIYSTPEMIAIERELQDLARTLAARQVSPSPSASRVTHLIGKAGLNAEQATAARQASAGCAIAIIEGAPGVGKTTLLTPMSRAWAETGWRVIGAAAAWKVAHALRDDLGIDARAVDSWLVGAEHGRPFLVDKTVLVVDEAGLLSSRQLHRILAEVDRATKAGARVAVRLVGDRAQLQAIGGPGLRIAADAIGVLRVETIVRQRTTWARKMVTLFGVGEAAQALELSEAHGCIQYCRGRRGTARSMVEAWREAHGKQLTGAAPLLIARTNAQVLALNAEVRKVLRREGKLAPVDGIVIPALTASGHEYALSLAVGDKLRFLVRVDGIGVINGTEVVLTKIEISNDISCLQAQLTVQVGAREVRVQAGDIADQRGRARIGHAYATTIYGAQGKTTEAAFLWIDATMDRHDVFVGSSRARGVTQFFVDQDSLDARVRSERALGDRIRPVEEEERRTALVHALSRSGAKASTLDSAAPAPSTVERQSGKKSLTEAIKLRSSRRKRVHAAQRLPQ